MRRERSEKHSFFSLQRVVAVSVKVSIVSSSVNSLVGRPVVCALPLITARHANTPSLRQSATGKSLISNIVKTHRLTVRHDLQKLTLKCRIPVSARFS